jgi:hypothetical protein
MLSELANDRLDVFIHGEGWYGNGTVCVEIWAIEKNPNPVRFQDRSSGCDG